MIYLVMENHLKVLIKSWKSHENLEVKICTNPVYAMVFKLNIFEININAISVLGSNTVQSTQSLTI